MVKSCMLPVVTQRSVYLVVRWQAKIIDCTSIITSAVTGTLVVAPGGFS